MLNGYILEYILWVRKFYFNYESLRSETASDADTHMGGRVRALAKNSTA